MTYPGIDPYDAEVDLDLMDPAVLPGGAHAGPVDLGAEADDVGEWDHTAATAGPIPDRAAPRPPARPAAEINAEFQARADRRKAAGRRRKITGTVMTAMILAAAAASVVGWPVVLAGLAAAGGTGVAGVAAVKGVSSAKNGGRNRRPRNGGAGYGPGQRGGNRRRLFGGRGPGGGGGNGRRRGAGGNPLAGLGLGGGKPKKATGGPKKATGGPKATSPKKATAGARSGPAAGKGRHRAGGPAGGRRRGLGLGLGGARARSRFGANNNRRRGRQTPIRQQQRRGGPQHQQRPRRTFGGQVRQARRNAIRQQRQQLAQQVGQHRATRRMQRRNGRAQRRIARQQTRTTARQARILRRQQSRAAYRARVRQRRLQRAAPHRAWWRRRAILAAARMRRRGRRFIARPVNRALRWTFGLPGRGWRRISPMTALGRRAQLLALLRQLNPTFGRRTQRHRRRAWYRRAAGAAWMRVLRISRSSWNATLGRMFAGLRRLLVAAAHNRRINLAQLWHDFATYLARFRPARAVPPPRPGPARQAPTVPFRGMDPAERAALAAALGLAAGAARQAHRTPPRRPAQPARPTVRPSTRTPRPAMAVPVRPAVRTPRGTTMAAPAQADAQEVTHATWETALSALNDHVANYQIPDDGTGVLDVDSFIASIGGFMIGLSSVLDQVGSELSEGPTHQVVVEQLGEFSLAITAMAADAGQVYEAWRTNEANAHDLRRAEGEIQRAELFNVGG